jgi:hypothetical protein
MLSEEKQMGQLSEKRCTNRQKWSSMPFAYFFLASSLTLVFYQYLDFSSNRCGQAGKRPSAGLFLARQGIIWSEDDNAGSTDMTALFFFIELL